MIDRYARKEIKEIWNEKNKYQIWLQIEIAAAQAMEKLKLIPKGVAAKVKRKAKINVSRIHKIESKVHHDVIAFLTSINEKVSQNCKAIFLSPLFNVKKSRKFLNIFDDFISNAKYFVN